MQSVENTDYIKLLSLTFCEAHHSPCLRLFAIEEQRLTFTELNDEAFITNDLVEILISLLFLNLEPTQKARKHSITNILLTCNPRLRAHNDQSVPHTPIRTIRKSLMKAFVCRVMDLTKQLFLIRDIVGINAPISMLVLRIGVSVSLHFCIEVAKKVFFVTGLEVDADTGTAALGADEWAVVRDGVEAAVAFRHVMVLNPGWWWRCWREFGSALMGSWRGAGVGVGASVALGGAEGGHGC
ncbi:hypothetical protein AC579_4218 [Pseudocercospora musae]|nr:hypothetical protein AC579_4218 [Pseudocercospora musae]KXT12638.1 hypothetical protein AC579_4218 [Pseudocercospora musae]